MYSLASIFTNIQNVPQAIRLADVFDILLVAFLIYLILVLLRRTHSYFILGGIGILFAVYLIARSYNLYLTELVFHTFFTFIIVIVVILFQRELRHFFELISILGRFSSRRRAVGSFSKDKIVNATEQLARQKMGALIVIEGRTPIDRLLEGGIALDGAISQQLLLSIFDSSSPGHDGAVIIHRDRIKRFGVHLPFSDNLREVAQFGTRHRAALGISERSDSLVVVVSEERGTIMVAHEGVLKQIEGRDELRELIDAFIGAEAVLKKKSWKDTFLRNSREKALSVLIASVLWFIFAFQFGVVSNEYQVPIEFRYLPQGYVVSDIEPKTADLTLSGRTPDFQLLNPGTLVLVIDSSELTEGVHHVKVDPDFFGAPADLSVVNFSPRTIKFVLKKAQ